MQERAQKTRARILGTATQLFSARGLNGATVDEIAAAAGVNKQRIYAYFGSKNGLFEAVLRDVFERVELFSRETVAKAARAPEKMTEIMVTGFLKVHAAHPDLWRLLAWANLEGPQCAGALNQARKKENEQLRTLYERNVESGLLRPVGFDTWLFTLLAVTCFRYSNELTLSHTLGWSPAGRGFEKNLARELNQLFTGRKDKK
jgi:TetR/AcrR family transcriptional regulator